MYETTIAMCCVLSACSLSHSALGSGESADETVVSVEPSSEPSAEREPVSEPLDAGALRPPSVVLPDGPTSARDAGPEAPPTADASSPVARDAGSELPACAGTVELGLCWYLSAPGASCTAACSARGGFDARSLGLVGTVYQGGSARSCGYVLHALGVSDEVALAPHYDGLGLGCHRWSGGSYWTDLPGWAYFSPERRADAVEIACACLR